LFTSVLVAKPQGIDTCTFHGALVRMDSQFCQIPTHINRDVVMFVFVTVGRGKV
jgi:hypothetical protein